METKCAHEPCTCYVEGGEQYCSIACREDAAAQSDLSLPHGNCRCRHSSCEAR